MHDERIRHYILATAGHVDHGKTALVRALTGVDTDRLPEEKARGITIELGFAHMTLQSPAGAGPAERYHVGVVDVPGHEDFVRNMVAGVGSVDAALLVVAADDGWMPQTEEHLQILSYLGVGVGVVALSKADLVADEAAAAAAVRDRLRGTTLDGAPIVATSCSDGRGIARLRAELTRVLAGVAPRADYGKPRLAVDRAFSLKGVGTVVTGTLAGGTLVRGQGVVVCPGGASARIRAIQTNHSEVEIARPGSRAALNLPDLSVSTDGSLAGARGVGRGDVVTVPELSPAGSHQYALLTRTTRPPWDGQSPPPVRHGTLVRFHHAAVVVPARLRLLEGNTLEPGSTCLAHLTLDRPVLACVGDRFVLRDWPGRQTLAGGVILDPDAPANARRARQPDLAWLRERSRDPLDPACLVRTQVRRDPVSNARSLLAKSCLGRESLDAALAVQARNGGVVVAGDWVIERGVWAGWGEAAVAAIEAHHVAHPEQLGLPLTQLRATLAPRQRVLPAAAAASLLDALVQDLCMNGYRCVGTSIGRAEHRPALPPRLQEHGRQIRLRLTERPFDPPARKDLCPTDSAHQALRFLIASGEVTDLSTEVALMTEAYRTATDRIRAHLQVHGRATVSELKSLLDCSRRVMVPLLERLDRDGVTRREGDVRTLR